MDTICNNNNLKAQKLSLFFISEKFGPTWINVNESILHGNLQCVVKHLGTIWNHHKRYKSETLVLKRIEYTYKEKLAKFDLEKIKNNLPQFAEEILNDWEIPKTKTNVEDFEKAYTIQELIQKEKIKTCILEMVKKGVLKNSDEDALNYFKQKIINAYR